MHHGIHKRWSYDGMLQLEENYVNGLLDGTLKEWSYDGSKLRKEVTYKNGIVVGTAKEWSYDGTLISEKNYDNGKLTKKTCWDEYGNRKKCNERPAEEPNYRENFEVPEEVPEM